MDSLPVAFRVVKKRDLMLNTLDISLDTLVFIDGNFEKKCVHVLTKPRLIWMKKLREKYKEKFGYYEFNFPTKGLETSKFSL